MDWPRVRDRLFRNVHPWQVLIAGLAVLGGLYGLQNWLQRLIEEQTTNLDRLTQYARQIMISHERYATLEQMKALDVARFKQGFSGVARSNKSLFESGLSLQEERRLLEKQLEIMTTYLIVNPALQRVIMMRGDQALQSALISYIPLKAFPAVEVSSTDAAPAAPITLPSVVRIISKERFAHPERGKSEEVNGRLQYNPPQVGTSVRSHALGEFVIFTNSPLILHGPPLNDADHEKFPHICLGLDLEAARKLYRNSFIGTKIILTNVNTTR